MSALAHDLFLKTDSYFLQPNSKYTVKVMNGTFQASEGAISYARLNDVSEVTGVLSNYLFPGNVRELENLIERMVVLSNEDALTLDDVPDYISQPPQIFGNVKFELPAGNISLDEVEREIIRYALDKHNSNQSQTARYLGITRSALIYRMQKSGLTPAEN